MVNKVAFVAMINVVSMLTLKANSIFILPYYSRIAVVFAATKK